MSAETLISLHHDFYCTLLNDIIKAKPTKKRYIIIYIKKMDWTAEQCIIITLIYCLNSSYYDTLTRGRHETGRQITKQQNYMYKRKRNNPSIINLLIIAYNKITYKQSIEGKLREEEILEKTYFTWLLADIISDIRFLDDKQQTRKQNNTNPKLNETAIQFYYPCKTNKTTKQTQIRSSKPLHQ